MENFHLLRGEHEEKEQPHVYRTFESFSAQESDLIRMLSLVRDEASAKAVEIKKALSNVARLVLLGIAIGQSVAVERTEGDIKGSLIPGLKAEDSTAYFCERAKTDKNETLYVITPDGQIAQIGGSSANVYFLKSDVMHWAGQSQDIIIGHTHPLAAYSIFGYNQTQIEDMRNVDPAPIPPSALDLGFILDMIGYIDNSGKNIEGRIVDASGVWTFSPDSKSQLTKDYIQGSKAQDALMDKLLNKYPEVEKQISTMKKQGVNSNVIYSLVGKFFPKFTEEYEDGIDKIRDSNATFNDISRKIEILQDIASNIARSNLPTEDGRLFQLPGREERLIEEYIVRAKEIGFNVEYKPHLN